MTKSLQLPPAFPQVNRSINFQCSWTKTNMNILLLLSQLQDATWRRQDVEVKVFCQLSWLSSLSVTHPSTGRFAPPPTLWELPICSDLCSSLLCSGHDPSPSSDLQGNHNKHLSFFLQRECGCLLQAHHLAIDVANSIWRLNAKWWLYCSPRERFFPRSNGCYWLLIWKN